MNWVHLLTSIEGRISRQPFWIAILPLIAIEIIAEYAVGERWSAIVSLILAYPEFAVMAKRGHDRNVPTWVVGAFMAGGILLYALVLLDLVGPPDERNALYFVILVPVGILGLILLIDFGFRRGTVGDNRYGPDPLAAQ